MIDGTVVVRPLFAGLQKFISARLAISGVAVQSDSTISLNSYKSGHIQVYHCTQFNYLCVTVIIIIINNAIYNANWNVYKYYYNSYFTLALTEMSFLSCKIYKRTNRNRARFGVAMPRRYWVWSSGIAPRAQLSISTVLHAICNTQYMKFEHEVYDMKNMIWL